MELGVIEPALRGLPRDELRAQRQKIARTVAAVPDDRRTSARD
jgi:hypothetical protein